MSEVKRHIVLYVDYEGGEIQEYEGEELGSAALNKQGERYGHFGHELYVLESHHISELAALREERDSFQRVGIKTMERLKAAYQRNATMTELLSEVSNDWLTGVCLGSPGTWFRRRDELMAKSTESGASE